VKAYRQDFIAIVTLMTDGDHNAWLSLTRRQTPGLINSSRWCFYRGPVQRQRHCLASVYAHSLDRIDYPPFYAPARPQCPVLPARPFHFPRRFALFWRGKGGARSAPETPLIGSIRWKYAHVMRCPQRLFSG